MGLSPAQIIFIQDNRHLVNNHEQKQASLFLWLVNATPAMLSVYIKNWRLPHTGDHHLSFLQIK